MKVESGFGRQQEKEISWAQSGPGVTFSRKIPSRTNKEAFLTSLMTPKTPQTKGKAVRQQGNRKSTNKRE
jgi:hypothetical protein